MSGLLKNEDYQLPHMLKMKIAFSKLLKTKDLKTPLLGVVDKTSCLTAPGENNSHHAVLIKSSNEDLLNAI